MQHTSRGSIRTKRTGTWSRARRAGWSYLFLLPAVALVLLFVVYPLAASYPYALYNWDGLGQPSRFVGLANFQRVASDPYFWSAFQHTAIFALVLVPTQLFLALVLALVLNSPKLRGSSFYRAMYFSPTITSSAVVGIVISYIFGALGEPFSAVARTFGLIGPTEQVSILSDPRFTLPAIIVVGIWHGLGYNLIYFLAALQSIPVELYEAARVDGATRRQEFWRITLPMLRAPGLIIFFLALTASLNVFEIVVVLAGTGASGLLSGAEVVSTYIYRNAFGEGNNVGFASAAALFMGVLTVALSVVQMLAFRSFRSRNARDSRTAGKEN